MVRIAVNLFGVFETRVEGVPIRMPTRRVELLLALLALDPGKALSRSYLAALLWPAQEEAQARASLRQAIFRLRAALGPTYADTLEVTSGWIKLRQDSVVRDVDLLVQEAAGEIPEGLPLDGLAGFEPETEDVLETARADLRRRLVVFLDAAEQKALGERRHADLERFARRHLSIEPYDEAALRALMTALWRQGRRNAALGVFRDVGQRIREELSVSVEEETRSLFETIRAAGDRPKSVVSGAAEAEAEQTAEVPPATAAPVDATDDLAHLRHLAVMHVISERLQAALRDPDPENAEAASRAAIADIEMAVSREGGEIVGRAGHHLSCVFGARRPDENPALSAAFAAFEIAVQDCAIGIHSGTGLVGADTGVFPLASLAQLLATAAETGEVHVTKAVEEVCRGAFEMSEVPPPALEGAGDRTPRWRLVRETAARGGFDIRKARGLSHFSGREAELATLADVAASRGPRIAVITGEAGIGKSRLVHEFLGTARPRTLLRVPFARGETGGGIRRFASIAGVLVGAPADAPAREVLHGIVQALPAESAKRLLPSLAGILDLAGEMKPWLELPRTQRLRAAADALLSLLDAFTDFSSVLLVEDVHWADEDARLLLEHLALSIHGASPMLIVTRRPGMPESWMGRANVRNFVLGPLEDVAAAALVDALHLPGTARSEVLARAGGVPLFLEELARAAVSDASLLDMPSPGKQPGAPLPEVPVALHGVLSHRIDALPGAARRVLEAAAVIGAEPTDVVLARVAGRRREAYDAALSALADADLFYRIRTFPERHYAFKHALIQDAAYHGIPAKRRAELHADVVAAYDALGLSAIAAHAAPLAFHALHGGLPDRAIDFAVRAVEQAVDRSGYAMANRMIDVALEAIRRSKPTMHLKRLEVDLLGKRRPLLWPLALDSGMEESLDRAEAIAVEIGDDLLLADTCIHRAYHHSDDGQWEKGLAYCQTGEVAARRAGDARAGAELVLARCQIFCLHERMKEALVAVAGLELAWDERRHAIDGLLVTRYVMLQFHLARAHAALGAGEAACRHAELGTATALETKRPVDRYIACRSIGDILLFAHAGDDALPAFLAARRVAQKADLAYYALWAEAEIAKIGLSSSAADAAADELERILAATTGKLHRVPEIKAHAALAIYRQDEDRERAQSAYVELLEAASTAGLPYVEAQLLEAQADLLHDSAPDRSVELKRQARRIVTTQGYAVCRVPAVFDAASLVDALDAPS